MASDSPQNSITIKRSDGREFLISESAAAISATMKTLMMGDDERPVRLPPFNGETLARVIAYLNKHAYEGLSVDDKIKFDDEFLQGVEIGPWIDLSWAANHLYIKSLMDLAAQKIADIIQNKSVEWVRKAFHIENDFTPEEEEKLRQEYAWAFEGVDED